MLVFGLVIGRLGLLERLLTSLAVLRLDCFAIAPLSLALAFRFLIGECGCPGFFLIAPPFGLAADLPADAFFFFGGRSGFLRPLIQIEITRQLGILAERVAGADRPFQNDARLHHRCFDCLGVGDFLRESLMGEIAIGAPGLKRSLHRRHGNRQIEKALLCLIDP